MGFQILIVEDDQLIGAYLKEIVSKHHRAFLCRDLQSAKKAISQTRFDLVFTDLNLIPTEESLEGLEVIKYCKEFNIPSVVLTSHGEEAVIQQAFKNGCSHYLVKDEFESELERIIRNTLGDPIEKYIDRYLNTTCSHYRALLKSVLERSQYSNTPILLTGETGVGKTHLAKVIHSFTDQAGPFVSKNLSELSDHVIESELFGHKKGAFTGALEDKKGWIEKANGGTLFLDEIGSLSPKAQVKLLKVLEEKIITPVGSTEEIKVDFKLITATCDDLQSKIQNGEFRVDFYFRIKGIEMPIPALKDRINDLDKVILDYNGNQTRKLFFTEKALNTLKSYDWPGNFRELQSLLTSLSSQRESLITEDIIKKLTQPKNSDDHSNSFLTPKLSNDILTHGLPEAVRRLEFEAFKKVVSLYGMKPNKICDALKISKSVFYRLQAQLEPNHG